MVGLLVARMLSVLLLVEVLACLLVLVSVHSNMMQFLGCNNIRSDMPALHSTFYHLLPAYMSDLADMYFLQCHMVSIHRHVVQELLLATVSVCL
jgi:hypothetical protein